MSEDLAKLVRARNRASKYSLPTEERQALRRLRRSAAENGATLHTNGEGGIAPSLALGVFRRDGWRCKRCGGATDLGLHHKGGVKQAVHWLQQGKRSNFANLVTLCDKCHDAVHDESRSLQ